MPLNESIATSDVYTASEDYHLALQKCKDPIKMGKKVAYREAHRAVTLDQRYENAQRYLIHGKVRDLKDETMRLMKIMRKNATDTIILVARTKPTIHLLEEILVHLQYFI